jgi:WD40 repeat protein
LKAETPEGQVVKVLKDIHFSPIRCMKFSPEMNMVISTDEAGMIELWDPETFEFPYSANKGKE